MNDTKPSDEVKLGNKVLCDSTVLSGDNPNDWHGGVMWEGERRMELVMTLKRAKEVLHMYETSGSTKVRHIQMTAQWKDYVEALTSKAELEKKIALEKEAEFDKNATNK
jgi:hypothetical protein